MRAPWPARCSAAAWKLATRPRSPTWYQLRTSWPRNASLAGWRRPGRRRAGRGRGARKTGDGRTWYIDPVDGTYNFLSGIPYWCSAVGLADATGLCWGRCTTQPSISCGWVGGRAPTTLNGERVPTLLDQPLSEVSVATYLHPRHLGDRQRVAAWQSVIASAATVRILGSASIDMAEVASSRLGVFLQANLNAWDWYPGAALVIGAGGAADELVLGTNRWQIAGNAQTVEDVGAALQKSAVGWPSRNRSEATRFLANRLWSDRPFSEE